MKSIVTSLVLVLQSFTNILSVARPSPIERDLQPSYFLQESPGKSVPSPEGEVISVEYQEVLREPTAFDRKMIRLQSFIISSRELMALYDPKTYPERSSMTWVDFGEKYRTRTRKDLVKALDLLLFPRDPTSDGKAKIIAVGLFEADPNFNDDPQNFKPGFGHMGMYRYRLTIECIERVEPVKD